MFSNCRPVPSPLVGCVRRPSAERGIHTPILADIRTKCFATLVRSQIARHRISAPPVSPASRYRLEIFLQRLIGNGHRPLQIPANERFVRRCSECSAFAPSGCVPLHAGGLCDPFVYARWRLAVHICLYFTWSAAKNQHREEEKIGKGLDFRRNLMYNNVIILFYFSWRKKQ